MAHSTRAAVLFLSLVPALLPSAAPAQKAPSAPTAPPAGSDSFFESVDVSVVNIEVFVTDKKGKRVTGLTKDDFTVSEDGKPVEVTYFYAAEGVAEGRPAAAGPEAERLQLAVYIDVEELPEKTRPRLVESIQRFVSSRARPEDQVLLASYNGPDSLTVRAVPADRQVLAAALQEVANLRRPAPTGSADLRIIARKQDQQVTPGGKLGTAMYELDRDDINASIQANQLRIRAGARSSLAALTQFLGGLGSLPGRKALLYVSANATFRPGQPISTVFDKKYGRGMIDGPLRTLMTEMEDAANSERILFYAMGTRDVLADAVNARQDLPGSNVRGAVDYNRDIIDADPDSALAWVGEDLESYYSLGYTPAKREPGKRHKVDVKVKRPGLEVRHVEAYRERTPNDRASGRTVAALLLGQGAAGLQSGQSDNPLGVRLEIGQAGPAAEPGKDANLVVPITVKFPLSRLTLLPGEGGAQQGRLAIFVTARDTEGRTSGVSEIKLPIQLKSAVPPGQTGSYTVRMMLRPLPHTIAVGVRDELGNTVSTTTVPYTPSAAPAAAGEKR
jgi:VWFA-related protein